MRQNLIIFIPLLLTYFIKILIYMPLTITFLLSIIIVIIFKVHPFF